MKMIRVFLYILLIALLGIIPAMAADTTVEEYRVVFYGIAPPDQTIYYDNVIVTGSDEITLVINGTPFHFPPGGGAAQVAKTPFDIYVTLEKVDKYHWDYIVHNDYEFLTPVDVRFLLSDNVTLTNGSNCGPLTIIGEDTIAPMAIPAHGTGSVHLGVPVLSGVTGTFSYEVNQSYLDFTAADTMDIDRTVSPVISVEKSFNGTAWKAIYTVENPGEDEIDADITFWYELREDLMGTSRTDLGNTSVTIPGKEEWTTTHTIVTDGKVPVFYLQADAHATDTVGYTITPAYPVYAKTPGDNTPPNVENITNYIIGEGLVAGVPLTVTYQDDDDDDDDDDGPTPGPTETQGPGPGPTDGPGPGPGPDGTPVQIGEEGTTEPFGGLAELFPGVSGLTFAGGIPWWVWLLLLIFLGAFLFLILKRTTDFESDIREGPAPLTVNFTDLSTNNPTTWHWDFGDGATSDEQHPVHTFAGAGTYTVTLTVHNRLGDHARTKNEEIKVT
ncbi:hypothetical protein AZH53_10895 [Methanomicrobiaceae archaeon CYW5]|uniref:PKD domain-containing protein n=1 Tax=Methanovulcanius yangii TaxID=1789227 RepID=UPI0029C9D187|nr:PKD domain-containing protein [Methanovulcanius yangii]MBT8508911.1 hypothetical protein [Methanovulcanius yangii]